MTVRVRIAPSPTGLLHIGTARTALFNYLFARHHGGHFILRIEDTDRVRSKDEYTENIITGLEALQMHWDEGPTSQGETRGDFGPYFQTQRTEIYRRYLQELRDKGRIYPCFCTPEEIQAEREQAEKEGKTYVYSGKCRDLELAEAQNLMDKPHVYRLKTEPKVLAYQDLIRGEVRFDTALIGDIVVARSDFSPLYNFAVVVDDAEMKISHVLRGEDHISNTPKQILIYESLGLEVPQFGHFNMILAPDRSKMSKRHGATAVNDYLAQGYLPEALLNYLALLGWSPGSEQELFSLNELEAAFDLGGATKSGAVFDIEKLKWMNGQWLRKLDLSDLWCRLQPVLKNAGYDLAAQPENWWQETVALVQEKLTLLPDYLEQVDFLLQNQLQYDPEQVNKALTMESAEPVLGALKTALAESEWQLEGIQAVFEQLKAEQPFKMKEIMWPIRAGLTGRTFGADLQQSILLLGRERCLARLDAALHYVKEVQN